jgi:hypothetical protein
MSIAIMSLPKAGSHSGNLVSGKSWCLVQSNHNLPCTGEQTSLAPLRALALLPFYAADIAELVSATTSMQVSSILLTDQKILGVRYMVTTKIELNHSFA